MPVMFGRKKASIPARPARLRRRISSRALRRGLPSEAIKPMAAPPPPPRDATKPRRGSSRRLSAGLLTLLVALARSLLVFGFTVLEREVTAKGRSADRQGGA